MQIFHIIELPYRQINKPNTTHLQLLSPGVFKVTQGSVNPVVVLDTALSCILGHGERLAHHRQPTDRLHH